MNLVVVGLGSNIDPNENIRTALRRIPELMRMFVPGHSWAMPYESSVPTWMRLRHSERRPPPRQSVPQHHQSHEDQKRSERSVSGWWAVARPTCYLAGR